MKYHEATEYVVLGALMTGAKHGYEINKYMSENLDGIWHISTSQLYALIHKLENHELVTGNISFGENLLSKKVLTITQEGKRRFINWVMSPTLHVRDLRMEFLTKLFFLRLLNLRGGDALLKAQVDLLTDLREKVEYDWGRQKDTFGKVVLGFKRTQFDACLNWLNSDAAGFIENISTNGTAHR